MKQTYKLFEGSNLQEAMDKCLKAGYFPITDLKKAYELKKKYSPDRWIDIGIVYQNGVIRPLKRSEARDLKKLYENKGCLLFLGFISNYYNLLVGSNLLDISGRFFGVKVRGKKK
jgi:hypothetical protein